MTIFHIGRNPLTAFSIGIILILIGLAMIVMEVVTEKMSEMRKPLSRKW